MSTHNRLNTIETAVTDETRCHRCGAPGAARITNVLNLVEEAAGVCACGRLFAEDGRPWAGFTMVLMPDDLAEPLADGTVPANIDWDRATSGRQIKLVPEEDVAAAM